MTEQKIIRFGFDLDGVIINKPPLVPKVLIEWFFKGGQKGLHYRFPTTVLEQQIRKLSHIYLFRPPIRKNINTIKQFHKQKGWWFYLITSRYSFLEKETYLWLEKRKVSKLFKKVCFNRKDEQPHLFKEKKLKELEIDVYFEDDRSIANYLRRKTERVKIYLLDDVGKKELLRKFLMDHLK